MTAIFLTAIFKESFYQDAEAYVRLLTEPDLEPTNNSAEQALRFTPVQRWVNQGTRGTADPTWLERIWTVQDTCAIQDRSVFEFLVEALTAQITHQPAP